MQEILDKLAGCGINAERKSIYDDLDALRDFGLDVKYKRGRPGGYYLPDRLLPKRMRQYRSRSLDRPGEKRRQNRLLRKYW